jgi:hypothetical protein
VIPVNDEVSPKEETSEGEEETTELTDDTVVRWTPPEGIPLSILQEIADEFEIEVEEEPAPIEAYKQLYEECEDDYCGPMPGDPGWEPEYKYFRLSFIGKKSEIDRAYLRFRELMMDYIKSVGPREDLHS